MKHSVKELANAITMDHSGLSVSEVLLGTTHLRYMLNMLVESMDAPCPEKMALYKHFGSGGRMVADWNMALILYKTEWRFRSEFEELHRKHIHIESLVVHAA